VFAAAIALACAPSAAVVLSPSLLHAQGLAAGAPADSQLVRSLTFRNIGPRR
jgi:hypothetical protein